MCKRIHCAYIALHSSIHYRRVGRHCTNTKIRTALSLWRISRDSSRVTLGWQVTKPCGFCQAHGQPLCLTKCSLSSESRRRGSAISDCRATGRHDTYLPADLPLDMASICRRASLQRTFARNRGFNRLGLDSTSWQPVKHQTSPSQQNRQAFDNHLGPSTPYTADC